MYSTGKPFEHVTWIHKCIQWKYKSQQHHQQWQTGKRCLCSCQICNEKSLVMDVRLCESGYWKGKKTENIHLHWKQTKNNLNTSSSMNNIKSKVVHIEIKIVVWIYFGYAYNNGCTDTGFGGNVCDWVRREPTRGYHIYLHFISFIAVNSVCVPFCLVGLCVGGPVCGLVLV